MTHNENGSQAPEYYLAMDVPIARRKTAHLISDSEDIPVYWSSSMEEIFEFLISRNQSSYILNLDNYQFHMTFKPIFTEGDPENG